MKFYIQEEGKNDKGGCNYEMDVVITIKWIYLFFIIVGPSSSGKIWDGFFYMIGGELLILELKENQIYSVNENGNDIKLYIELYQRKKYLDLYYRAGQKKFRKTYYMTIIKNVLHLDIKW